MAVIPEQSVITPGHYEPEVTRQFLPGCRSCGGSHPLARKGYTGDLNSCPDCNGPAGTPGQVYVDRGTLSGFSPSILAARALIWAGKSLSKFSKRIV